MNLCKIFPFMFASIFVLLQSTSGQVIRLSEELFQSATDQQSAPEQPGASEQQSVPLQQWVVGGQSVPLQQLLMGEQSMTQQGVPGQYMPDQTWTGQQSLSGEGSSPGESSVPFINPSVQSCSIENEPCMKNSDCCSNTCSEYNLCVLS